MELKDLFIDECYKKAIRLKKDFRITEKKRWNELIVALELGVQIGHVFDIMCNSNELKEEKRIINNMGDEISDVLLQVLYLGYLEGVNFKENKKIDYYDINGIMVLYGQLVEALMEKYSYRFIKKRIGFETIKEFIKDRIIKIYLIIINFSVRNNINVIDEFNKMENDAKGFLDKYEKNNSL